MREGRDVHYIEPEAGIFSFYILPTIHIARIKGKYLSYKIFRMGWLNYMYTRVYSCEESISKIVDGFVSSTASCSVFKPKRDNDNGK